MNDRQEQHLNLLSQMDEQIVEEVTVERYARVRGLARRKKIRWISILASAACFFLLFSFGGGLLRLFGVLKHVPVYEGMTVSNEFSGAEQADLRMTTVMPMLEFAAGGGQNAESPKLPHDSKPIEEVVESTLRVEGSGEPLYYAEPNQEIYITVHIDNPDKFEILSFTLNGEKYSSYMFEEGSDMENLVLKVNVGDAQPCEILTYTIDAIKYVDGTAIKDVRMKGDDTVQIGITPDITVREKKGVQSLTLTVMPTEPHASTSEDQMEIYAVLYDGETLINKKKITLAASAVTVTFEGLDEQTTYRYGIVALYHANVRVLAEKTMITLIPIRNGKITKKYSITTQVLNKTTGDFRAHLGCDIIATDDPNVYSIAGQIVKISTSGGSDGKLVAIRATNGDTFYYRSLGSVAEGLSVGQSVSYGQVIGTVGSSLTVESAESPHLHLEIKDANGEYVDPAVYMDSLY